MSFQPDWTVLVQDLLSPAGTVLPGPVLSLISYHIASLPASQPTHTRTLFNSILTSPSLWDGLAHSSIDERIPLGKAESVLGAVRNGVMYRLQLIEDRHTLAWWAQSELSKWIRTVTEAVTSAGARRELELVVLSALLAGLQQAKMSRKHPSMLMTSILQHAEAEVMTSWSAYFAESDAAAAEDDILPLWLLCQTIPSISAASLSAGHVDRVIGLLTANLRAAFWQGTLFVAIDSDLHQVGPSELPLRWAIPSASHSQLSQLTSVTRFALLGPLSRSLGRAYEAAALVATPSALDSLYSSLASLASLCEQVQRGWRASAWSELTADEQLTCEPGTAAALPWIALKSLLFSITLVLSSVLVLASPKPGEKPTWRQAELALTALEMLSTTYFVASKFGPDGFGAWKGAWAGLVGVVKLAQGENAAEATLDRVCPPRVGEPHAKVVDRATATFYLNLAEQLAGDCSRGFVERQVLHVCRPYLRSSEHRDPFESAHSVLLAVFAAHTELALELAPWYTALLLNLNTKRGGLSPTQLRLAYTTMVRSVSASDDALALWCVTQLVEAIKTFPASAPSAPNALSTAAEVVSEPSRSFAVEPTTLAEASPATANEDAIVALPRGTLLLALIDQAAAVNLFLLEKVLERVWALVREEGDAQAREALGRSVFVVLSEGLSKEKREVGTEWWLNRAEELVQ